MCVLHRNPLTPPTGPSGGASNTSSPSADDTKPGPGSPGTPRNTGHRLLTRPWAFDHSPRGRNLNTSAWLHTDGIGCRYPCSISQLAWTKRWERMRLATRCRPHRRGYQKSHPPHSVHAHISTSAGLNGRLHARATRPDGKVLSSIVVDEDDPSSKVSSSWT